MYLIYYGESIAVEEYKVTSNTKNLLIQKGAKN